jgi:hypothetical protein
MSDHDEALYRVGQMLAQIARPYRVDESLPIGVRTNLWQLGFACNEMTPREELIARLWARKRSLQIMVQPLWGGPGATPPSAA